MGISLWPVPVRVVEVLEYREFQAPDWAKGTGYWEVWTVDTQERLGRVRWSAVANCYGFEPRKGSAMVVDVGALADLTLFCAARTQERLEQGIMP
jgi:hypothetical protein